MITLTYFSGSLFVGLGGFGNEPYLFAVGCLMMILAYLERIDEKL